MSKPELPAARAEFERRLADWRGSFADELGFVPKPARWLLPLAAAAVGFVAGRRVRRRARQLRGPRR